MAQPTENTTTITRMSAKDNVTKHGEVLEEMKNGEKDKTLVLDRAIRYEFAQPVDDGQLYKGDTTFGKIRAAKWEPHEYAYDTKQIGGSMRCWKVGEPVVIAKEKKSAIQVIPMLFLRGFGPKAKHRVLLYTATPSPDFASLNRGAPHDTHFVVRLLDQFSEESFHATGPTMSIEELRTFQEDGWSFLRSISESKEASAIAGDEEAEEGVGAIPAAARRRGRSSAKRQLRQVDDADESSEPAAIATAHKLEQHVHEEKEHEKEHKKDLKRLIKEIDDMKNRIGSLEHELADTKQRHTSEKESVEKKLKKLKGKITSSLQQPHLAMMQAPAPSAASFTTAMQPTPFSMPAQLPFVPVQQASGGYLYFPASAQQGASGRSM